MLPRGKRRSAPWRATTLLEVMLASAIAMLVGLIFGGMPLSYSRMARATVLAEELQTHVRRTMKNQSLGIRNARGVSVSESGLELRIQRPDGGLDI